MVRRPCRYITMCQKDTPSRSNSRLKHFSRSECGTKIYEIIKYYSLQPKYNFKKIIKTITNSFIHKTVTNKLKDKFTKKFIIVV